MEDRMATLVAEADVHKAQLESSAGILGQQQQLEEAARRQVMHVSTLRARSGPLAAATAECWYKCPLVSMGSEALLILYNSHLLLLLQSS